MKPYILLLGWALLASGPARAGDEVGNHGGSAENNVMTAFTSMDRFVLPCLSQKTCLNTDAERLLLTKIYQALPTEQASIRPIEFLSETEKPGFFMIDGMVRAMKTGSTVGSTIYVNRDQIYFREKQNGQDILVPMGVQSAVALLIHELGHHHGEKDHTALDLLGARVVAFSNKFIASVQWNNGLLASLSSGHGFSQSQLLIETGDGQVDVAEGVLPFLRCPDQQKPKAFHLRNLHEGWPNHHWSGGREENYKIRLNSWLWMQCGPQLVGGQELDISFDTRKRLTREQLLSSLEIVQVDCVTARPRQCL